MEKRKCQNCKNEFSLDQDDLGFYEKMKLPLPDWCPECRLQRRLSWRNERGLHFRKCGLCDKKIVSIYSEDYDNTVYCEKCWWSDDWEGLDYGMEIDFSKPFLVQFLQLFHKVPANNLFAIGPTMVNSEYCNMSNDMRNCYLLHDGTFDENVSYGSGVFFSKDSQDITMARKCELSYELVTCINCYQTIFSQNCQDCVNVSFSFGLRGCNNCFGCVNLHGKNYHIWNILYSREEYEEKIKSFGLDSYKNVISFKEQAHEFWQKFPKKYYFGVQNVRVTGDYLEHSKNSKECFGCANLEDSKFCSFVSNGPVRTTYDFTHYGDNIEMVYESAQCGNGIYDLRCGWGVWDHCRNVSYCLRIVGTADSFGCVGLKKKQYCILNKQYTKEEYEKLVPKLIEHINNMPYVDKKGREYKYGAFFPSELSPFGYNETTAQEYFTLNKEKALAQGFNWREDDQKDYKITKKPEELPDSISNVGDSILDAVIACEHEGKCQEGCMTAFRVLPEDLKFYRRMNLPLPRMCFNCRRFQRVKQRNPLKLWHRKCMNEGCENEFETSYAPERPEIVYCESCYNKEVY